MHIKERTRCETDRKKEIFSLKKKSVGVLALLSTMHKMLDRIKNGKIKEKTMLSENLKNYYSN